jgi:hypothetical protein
VGATTLRLVAEVKSPDQVRIASCPTIRPLRKSLSMLSACISNRRTKHSARRSSSWLNLVERFFAEITRKRIRRGVFKSVTDLEVAIHYYLAEHAQRPPQAVRLERQGCRYPHLANVCRVAKGVAVRTPTSIEEKEVLLFL